MTKKATVQHSDSWEIKQAVKHAKLVADSRRAARIVQHVDPSASILKKRKHLEASLERWLTHFLPEAFADPWSDDHLKVLTKIEACICGGGLFAEAMPRGHGKSTICKGAVLFAILTGHRKYVMSIAATADLAEAMVDFVRQQITENDLLHQYYPHVTTYARATDGKAIKARYQLRADGKESGIQWSKNTLILPEVITASGKDYASNGAILEAHGLTGAIRGKWKDTKTGKVVRPDFVILDDPQTRESAESDSQCRMREKIITGDVLGLAGPRRRIAAVMPCTIVRKGDLADRFLDHDIHPEWQGETCSLVYKWPKVQETLWTQYAQIFKKETSEGRGFQAATDFYLENRDAMDEGAVVSWPHRVRDKEISAIQTAENLLLEMGPQFWAEYQNQPRSNTFELYEISPRLVSHRLNGMKRHQLDPMIKTVVAFTDINFAALRWAVVGFKNDRSGFVLDYGSMPERGVLVPKNATVTAQRQLIAEGLDQWFRKLASMSFEKNGVAVPIRAAGVDRGYFPDVVHSVCRAARLPFGVLPAKGYGGTQYRPTAKGVIGKPGHNCHLTESQYGQYLASNTDYFKEQVQRGFLAAPGAPGSVSLWGNHAEHHAEFSEHICAETLSDKAEGARGTFWKWSLKPGACNDLFDAVTGCFSLGAWFLGGPEVTTPATTKAAPRRNVKQNVVRKPSVRIEE